MWWFAAVLGAALLVRGHGLTVRSIEPVTELRRYASFRAGAFSASSTCAATRVSTVETMCLMRLEKGAELMVALAVVDDADAKTEVAAVPEKTGFDAIFTSVASLVSPAEVEVSDLMHQSLDQGHMIVGIVDLSSEEFDSPRHSLSPTEGLYLTALAVHPTWRRKGVATELLDAAERHARHLDLPRLMFHVDRDNEAAVQFYRARGFESMPQSRRYDDFAKSMELTPSRHILYSKATNVGSS